MITGQVINNTDNYLPGNYKAGNHKAGDYTAGDRDAGDYKTGNYKRGDLVIMRPVIIMPSDVVICSNRYLA